MKALILAPHGDDEVLGCGGYLAKNPGTSHVVYLAKHNGVRSEETRLVKEYLDFESSNLNLIDTQFYKEDISRVADSLNEIIINLSPTTIFIPYPSVHQDHQFTYHTSLIALRKFTGTILSYEYLEGQSFFIKSSPNMYLELTGELLNKKIHALTLYKSQIKEGRDIEAILGLAKMRGYESHCKLAEAYQLIKGRLQGE
jgi:LmbE family N-acetylglucosaminyl deacetylase